MPLKHDPPRGAEPECPQPQPGPDEPAAGRLLLPAELVAARVPLERLRQQPRLPLIGVLENIRSLGNVGSMFRTADAVRLDRLILCGFTGHPPRKEIEKTALGATDSVPWEYWSRAADACRHLRTAGWRVLALELTTRSIPLESLRLEGPTAFLVGNELAGLTGDTLAACDGAFELPMAGMKESLNVAVAFGVAAYALESRLPAALRLR
jgi:tRNA G18 (ribose-2'-O)-methylase SpoU